jgi:LysR family malonate utilization transcriptional regulator
MKRLHLGEVDAIMIAVPRNEELDGIEIVPLFEDQLYLASSKNSKPKKESVDLSEYEHEKFLTLQDGFATTASFYDAFRLAGVKPNVVMKVGDIFSLMNMVSKTIWDDLCTWKGKSTDGGCAGLHHFGIEISSDSTYSPNVPSG